MLNLSQREERFFIYFNEFARIVCEATKILLHFTQDLNNSEIKFREIEEIEHRGDKQLHDIMQALNKTYLTPFDREDVYEISKRLDDIVDCVEAAASKFVLFDIKEPTEDIIRIANKIAVSGEEVVKLIAELKNIKGNKKILDAIKMINQLEDEGDKEFRDAVKHLFDKEQSPVEVLKWKEIYSDFEDVLNACEDIADTVEGVLMKHA